MKKAFQSGLVFLSWPRSLQHKLLLGYAAMLIVIAVPAGFSVKIFLDLNATVRQIVFQDMEAKSVINHIYLDLSGLEERHRTFVWFGDPEIFEEAQTKIEQLKASRDELEGLIPNPGAEGVLVDLTNQLDALQKEINKDGQEVTPSGLPEREARSRALEDAYDGVRATTNTLIQRIQETIEDRVRNLSKTAEKLFWLMFGCITIALIMTLCVPWWLHIYVDRPIKALHAGTVRISKGEFDHSLEVRKHDELGDLASAFNRMACRLRELDQMKADFIAVVSHELRTPLTSMLEAVNLLGERKVGTLNKDQETLLNILGEGMLRLNGLITDLLDLSKMEARLLEIEAMPTDLSGILESAKRTLAPQAHERAIALEVQAPKTGPVLFLDEEKVLRAVLNLVNNAIKFSPRGYTVRMALKPLGTADEPDGWQLAIIDQGPGIPEAEQELIFDKFYQVKMSRQRGGTGLGLSIARQIIEAHGGSILIESPVIDRSEGDEVQGAGPGSAFLVRFPLHGPSRIGD